MANLSPIVQSTVGRKILNGLTGLLLCVYIVIHLIANLLIIFNPDKFNAYAHTLTRFGWVLYAVEIALLAVFVIHAITAVMVWLEKRSARPEGYRNVRSAGSPSRKTISSRTMIYTGILLAIFIVIHVKTFKYGAHYVTTYHGEEIKDLYRVVVEEFTRAPFAIGYEVIMILLGYHLRHGFWSAFQSLGMSHPKYSPFIYGFGIFFAIVIAVGFLTIPPYIYFTGGAL